jgi:predicted nucleic acid-binding protein
MSGVLDASVLVAALSPSERRHNKATGLLARAADRPFLVPALFRVEVVAAFARRGGAPELLDAVDAYVRGPRFQAIPIDDDLVEAACTVAREAKWRAYDSVYVALARIANLPLLTFDDDVASRVAASLPGVRIEPQP